MMRKYLKAFLVAIADRFVDIWNARTKTVLHSFLMHVEVFFNSILECFQTFDFLLHTSLFA